MNYPQGPYGPPQGYGPPPPGWVPYGPPPPKKSSVSSGCGCLILGLLGLLVLMIIWVSRVGGHSSTTVTPAASASGHSGPAVVASATKVAAGTIAADYAANEVRADSKWKGQIVEVSGTVTDIRKDLFDNPVIVLSGNGVNDVHISLRHGSEKKAASVDKWATIRVRGKVRGMILVDVVVDEAEIL